ncbi:MAG TPA: hypothetical protein VFO46_06015 [Candidatus Sulfotelmatobacter sp.]|nr:hypothetical protein [Candidatus Sulfotelmatobacter sp.]
MKKWEYRIDGIDLMEAEAAIALLDRLGAEGWELVTSFSEKNGNLGLIFKREGEAVHTSADEV